MTSNSNMSKFLAIPQTALSRRAAFGSMLAAGTAAALTIRAGKAHAADDGSHSGMDHSMMGAKHQAVIDKALVCVNRGEVCLNHCVAMLNSGDTSMKDCMAIVSAMLPMCSGLAKLAALDAARLKDYAKLCADVCADCEKECRKHEAKHAVCKACADSCADCVKECKVLIGA